MAGPSVTSLGALDQIVAVDVETTPRDSEAVPVWEEIGSFRAEVTPMRASESEREGAVRTLSVYRFLALARAAEALGLASRHRLRWKSLTFNVREVRTPPSRTVFVEIIAETGVTL